MSWGLGAGPHATGQLAWAWAGHPTPSWNAPSLCKHMGAGLRRPVSPEIRARHLQGRGGGAGGPTFHAAVGVLPLGGQQAGQEQGVLGEQRVDHRQREEPRAHGALWGVQELHGGMEGPQKLGVLVPEPGGSAGQRAS